MKEVRLFATCLGEQIFPQVIAATRKVLERLGLQVKPVRQAFCCGQAAFNDGMRDEAKRLAKLFLDTLEPGVPVIVPSGSCTSMFHVFYPDLLADDSQLREKAAALRPWIFELSDFLVNQLKVTDVGARFEHRVAYHPSCHLLRELHLKGEPLMLLRAVRGIRLCELGDATECCGFGGLFSVKFPEISGAILRDKLECVRTSGAEVLTANDAGCLMQIGGGLHREGIAIQTMHLAEILVAR